MWKFWKKASFDAAEENKRVVQVFSQLIENELGFPKEAAIEVSTSWVKEALSSTPPNANPYKSTQGDEFLEHNEYVQARLDHGLTKQDIKNYWNRPLLIMSTEGKLLEFIQYTNLSTSEEHGRDLVEAAAKYKRYAPNFGNPRKVDPNETDPPIYREFSCRIDNWLRQESMSVVDELVNQEGSFNAAIRHLIKSNKLPLANENGDDKYVTYYAKITKYLSSGGRLIW